MKKWKKYRVGFVAMVFVTTLALVSCAGQKPREYLIADLDPVDAGVVKADFPKFFSNSLTLKEIGTQFDPRKNTVILSFSYQGINYKQVWDEQDRQLFTAALERYKQDYANKALIKKPQKTRKAYGSFQTDLQWQMFKFSSVSRSKPKVDIGYRYLDNSWHLLLSQREARELTVNSERDVSSPRISIYFTRAKAEDLAAIFDQAYLVSLVKDWNPEPEQAAATSAEDY